jgi:hypothetical protein
MGCWGFKSYENDHAADALDRAFELVHQNEYERLMDDGNPLSFDQVQQKLANNATLDAAIAELETIFGDKRDEWDDEARLAFVGVIVRHAEARVKIPNDLRQQTASWLDQETLEWDEPTKRTARREQEIQLLLGSQ